MAQNEHKKVLQELSEAYAQVNEGHAGPVDPKYYGLEKEFNELENKRERARDRGREAEDKGDWDEWNKQENEREDAKDALREIEDAEDTPSVGDIFDGIDYDEMIVAIEDDGTIYTRELAEGGNRYSADEFTYEIKDRIEI